MLATRMSATVVLVVLVVGLPTASAPLAFRALALQVKALPVEREQQASVLAVGVALGALDRMRRVVSRVTVARVFLLLLLVRPLLALAEAVAVAPPLLIEGLEQTVVVTAQRPAVLGL